MCCQLRSGARAKPQRASISRGGSGVWPAAVFSLLQKQGHEEVSGGAPATYISRNTEREIGRATANMGRGHRHIGVANQVRRQGLSDDAPARALRFITTRSSWSAFVLHPVCSPSASCEDPCRKAEAACGLENEVRLCEY